MLDEDSIEDFENAMRGTMEHNVITSLLSGNDTLCFTTQQYCDMRDKWIAKVTGATREELGLDQPPIEITRNQIIESRLVREVSPNVWTNIPL